MANTFGPVAGRFTRSTADYVQPASLARWERSAVERLPQMRPPRGQAVRSRVLVRAGTTATSSTTEADRIRAVNHTNARIRLSPW